MSPFRVFTHRKLEDRLKKNKNTEMRGHFDKGISKIKKRGDAGIHIPEKGHKKGYAYYQKKYGVTMLFKFNVGGSWRMINTLLSDENGEYVFVLDFLQHKEYDRVFGYKTR